jgi:hypothetical protein
MRAALLTELIACLRHEIKGDHHRLALSFLAALGIEDPARIEALPVTFWDDVYYAILGMENELAS